MSMLTTDGNRAFLPEEAHDLVVRPAIDTATATQVATVVTTDSGTFRIPVVAADPTASWVDEAEEIPTSDATLAEAVVVPAKLAGLTVISRELAEDSTPAAANIVGQGLARDIARKLDVAFYGAELDPAPDGLDTLAGVSPVDPGAAWANLDPFEEAVYTAEGETATLTGFVANPADALTLTTLKESADSNRALLQADPTEQGRRTLAGRPLYVSPAVTAGTIWGIPRDRTFVVVRSNATVDVDRSAFFTSDQVAVRATVRVGFGFPHPAAIVKIALTA